MSLLELDNLVRIGQLKSEPRNDAETKRLLEMARTLLTDSKLPNLSALGRYIGAYNAAHAAALAALRWQGYRSENRYTVFQCLTHTLSWSAPRWRVLDAAHQKRNRSEYEGFLEIEESSIKELQGLVAELLTDVANLIEKQSDQH